MTEYIKNPISGKLRGVTYEDGKIIDVHIRDTDDVVKVFVPVRRGRCKKSDGKDEWYTYYYTCVECGANMMVADSDYHDVSPNYCPNCGAKMDGGND